AVADELVGGDAQRQKTHDGEDQEEPVDDLASGAPGGVAQFLAGVGRHRGAGVTCLVDGGRARGRTKSAVIIGTAGAGGQPGKGFLSWWMRAHSVATMKVRASGWRCTACTIPEVEQTSSAI